MVLEKLDVHFQNNEIRLISITLHKSQLQVNKRLQFATRNAKSSGENTVNTLYNVGTGTDFLNRTLFAQELRATVCQVGFSRAKKPL